MPGGLHLTACASIQHFVGASSHSCRIHRARAQAETIPIAIRIRIPQTQTRSRSQQQRQHDYVNFGGRQSAALTEHAHRIWQWYFGQLGCGCVWGYGYGIGMGLDMDMDCWMWLLRKWPASWQAGFGFDIWHAPGAIRKLRLNEIKMHKYIIYTNLPSSCGTSLSPRLGTKKSGSSDGWENAGGLYNASGIPGAMSIQQMQEELASKHSFSMRGTIRTNKTKTSCALYGLIFICHINFSIIFQYIEYPGNIVG